MTADQIIDAAQAAHDAAALRIWERDEREDRGSCGGFILTLHASSAVAKALIARKLGYRSSPGVTVAFRIPAEIRSQNADVPDAACRAARAVFEANGVRVIEARPYTD